MRRVAWTTGAAATALLAAATCAPAFAADNCVRVLGYEWSGEKQSMDPSGMWSGDEGYHIFAAYNRLMDVDPNFKLVPELAESWSVSDDGATARRGLGTHRWHRF